MATGCAPGPDLVSSNSVDYFFRGIESWAVEDVERVEAGLISAFESLEYPRRRVISGLERVTVYVGPDPISCSRSTSPTGWCNGLETEAMLQIRDLGPPCKSALAHEMAHWIQWWAKGESDPRHENTGFWARVDGNCDPL